MSISPRSRRAVLGPLVLASVVALGLAGCAAPAPTPSPSSSSAEGPAKAHTSGEKSPAVRVDASSGPIQLNDYGPHGVITGTSPESSGTSSFTTTAVVEGRIVTGSGELTEVDGSGEIRAAAYGAQQEDVAKPAFVGAGTSHVPASGLNPEAWVTNLEVYEAGADTAGATVPVPACSDSDCEISGVSLFGNVAVLGFQYSLYSQAVVAMDLTTGAELWRLENVVPAAVSGHLLVLRSLADNESDTAGVLAVDGETGQTAWTFADEDGQPAGQIGPILSPDYAAVTSTPPGVTNADDDRVTIVDLRTGKAVLSRIGYANGIAYDATTERFVLGGLGASGEAGGTLEIASTDGSTVFSIPAEQYEALGEPRVIGALDGGMWIMGQRGVDQIDEATGKQLPTSPQVTEDIPDESTNITGIPDPVLPYRVVINGDVAAFTTVTSDSFYLGSFAVSPAGAPTVEEIYALSARVK
jgi:hypothetical protein